MQVYPLNEKEVQRWRDALMGAGRFSRHLGLVVVANVFYLAALIVLNRRLAAETAQSVVLMGDVAAVSVAVLAGHYLFHLYRSTRALLEDQAMLVAQQKNILRVSYIAFRLYFVLLMALGALMAGIASI